jgi:hypothetical protein
MNKRAFIDTSFIIAALSVPDSYQDLAIKQSEDLYAPLRLTGLQTRADILKR